MQRRQQDTANSATNPAWISILPSTNLVVSCRYDDPRATAYADRQAVFKSKGPRILHSPRLDVHSVDPRGVFGFHNSIRMTPRRGEPSSKTPESIVISDRSRLAKPTPLDCCITLNANRFVHRRSTWSSKVPISI